MKEKMVIHADRKAYLMDMILPVALVLAVLAALMWLVFPPFVAMLFTVFYVMGMLVYSVMIVPRSKAVYTFLPATEYRGTRLQIQMGHLEFEVSDAKPSDFIFGRSLLEKRLGAGHIKVKGTLYKLRGMRVDEMDAAKAWVEANFPEKKAVHASGKKGKKRK